MSTKLVTTNPSKSRAGASLALATLLGFTLSIGCGAAAKQHAKIAKAGENFRLELAQLYVEKGARKAAVPLLKKILGEQPKNIKARVLYGCVLRDLGLLPQAERHLKFALKLAPRYAGAHASMGILRDLQRRHPEAMRHHVAAVRLSPRNAGYRNNLGFSFYLSGKNDRAIKHLERALAMDPGLTVAYNNLGFAYGKQRRFKRARRTFRTALGESSTLLNMALVYERHGQAGKASALRERAYVINPDLRPMEGK